MDDTFLDHQLHTVSGPQLTSTQSMIPQSMFRSETYSSYVIHKTRKPEMLFCTNHTIMEKK